MISDWIAIAQRFEFRRRVVFLEDYDIALAQELVQGVDVWINTPRRPWEACGTSGMKVLVNGGLNLSERDGWWEEAFAPELGWAIGDDQEYPAGEQDARDAEALYSILEQQVVPEFYARDAAGMPRQWIGRVRRSMAELAPVYSSSRMARDYVERYYLPGTAELRRRMANGDEAAREMRRWEVLLRRHWPDFHIGQTIVCRDGAAWSFSVPIDLGELAPQEVAVQLYAEPNEHAAAFLGELSRASSSRQYLRRRPHRETARRKHIRCELFPAMPGRRFRRSLRSSCGRNEGPRVNCRSLRFRLICINEGAQVCNA